MSIYENWGFAQNPFETRPLSANDEGSRLLIGRDHLVSKLQRRLDNASKIPTVEGLNGIGKTSLVNVTLHRAFKSAVTTKTGPLYIPCRRVFQLSGDEDPDAFRRGVLLEVAQTLLETHASLPDPAGRTRASGNSSIDRFINSPQVRSFSAGLWILNGGVNLETNTGFGYEESGFEKALEAWLADVFPTEDKGAVVCTIDNLELLQTSERVRDTLEVLRDTLFSMRGIRWVLCGAPGIIHGVASTPRLDGRLQKPIFIEELDERFAPVIYQERVKVFRRARYAKLPLTESNFVEVFDIMRGNIRSVLSECDEFCMWVADRAEHIEDFEEDFFEIWLQEELEAAYNAVRQALRPRAFAVFETACQFEAFSPSDCIAFGYETPQAMRPQIKALEEVGLLTSSIDDSDKRRKTIQVTAKGWKVRAYLDFLGDDQ